MSHNWTIGMALNFVGSITINLGTNLMKYSHVVHESRAESTLNKWQKYSWSLGIMVFSIGNAFNFMSFGYAAQSLLACIGSVQFVSNVVFAFLLLNEKVTRRVIEGTCVIVLGNTFTLLFASHESKNYSVDELYVMYIKTPFVVYICLVFVTAVVLTISYYRLESTKVNDTKKILKQIGCYSITSAMVGSLGVLLAKSLSQLLRTTMSGDNQFVYFFTYFVFFGWIGLTIFWMERLNSGLRKFPSMIIVPALQVFWTVFSILSGGIYFGEFSDFSWAQTIGFSCGVIIIISGVHHLAPFNTDSTDMPDGSDIEVLEERHRQTGTNMSEYTEDDELEPMDDLSSETNPFLSHESYRHPSPTGTKHINFDSSDEESPYSSDITSTRWKFHLPKNMDVGISTPLVVMTPNVRSHSSTLLF